MNPSTTNHPAPDGLRDELAACGVQAVLARMHDLLRAMAEERDPRRYFLATYSRTTAAVGEAIRQARFEDPAWVDRWDVAFAQLYLDALEAHSGAPGEVPRPWRAALGADPALHPLLLVLLGMNAHINYDLPQALLAVITDDEFDDPALMGRRRRDHTRIDAVLAARVSAEDRQLKAAAREGTLPGRNLLDRAMGPVNRSATRRFLAESRRKVWHNAMALHDARRRGPQAYRQTLADLEVLAAAKVADLMTPGPVLVRLAAGGFGVLLPPC